MNPTEDPLQKALLLGPHGDAFRDSRIEIHGWATVGGNWSNANNSNLPTAYWIVPNTIQLDQAVLKFEREIDWVQTDHIDWGFRSVNLYGIDYRYTTAGGVSASNCCITTICMGTIPSNSGSSCTSRASSREW